MSLDFGWSPEQLERRARVVTFARERLDHDVAALDSSLEFPRDAWRACAEAGIQSLAVPAGYNSSGETTELLDAILVMEGLGYGCPDNGLAFALNAQMWTVQSPIYQFGTEEQRRGYLPRLCSGEIIGAHCLTEPESGSDVFSLATLAERCDAGYVLNGRKRYISLGPVADVFLLFATVKPELGKWGVTAFLVDGDNPGLTRGPPEAKMGLRTVPICELSLTNCVVPESARLGKEGAGVSISTHCLELERCSILASQIGAMERQLEEAVRYSRSRKQFGTSIGKFQSVSNRVADMKLRLETARLLLYKVAWMRQTGKTALLEAALLKLYLSEAFVESSLDAIRIHGGRGYMSAAGVERDLRDAVGGVLYAGTNDIQRNIVARLLGL